MTVGRYILLVIALVVIVSGVVVYYKMGGFNSPEMVIFKSPPFTIVGKNYTGRMNEKAFGKMFEDAEELVKNGKVKGMVCAWFENSPEAAKDTVKAFIGVCLFINDSLTTVPQGYSVKQLPFRYVAQAHIKASYMLAPKVYPKLKEFAKEKGSPVNDAPALELYKSENEVIIQLPVK